MQVDVEPTGLDGALIRVNGRLNMVTAPRFREPVTRIVGQDGRMRIVVELAGTHVVDSTGLGALISGLKTARSTVGQLHIALAGTQVMTVLQLTNLDRILHTHDTVEECSELAMSNASHTAP